MVFQSQAGTGKTAAFILTILARVDASKKVVQVRVGRVRYIRIGAVFNNKNKNNNIIIITFRILYSC